MVSNDLAKECVLCDADDIAGMAIPSDIASRRKEFSCAVFKPEVGQFCKGDIIWKKCKVVRKRDIVFVGGGDVGALEIFL